MSPQEFIHTNIANILIKDGYSLAIAIGAADAGWEEYKRRSCSTQKGKIFDDCLDYAKAYAKKLKKSAH